MVRRFSLGLGIIPTRARPVPTAPPVNTVLPSITGILTQGQTLTADPGSWTGLPSGAFTYQWQRSGSNISGATNSTYVAQAADVAAGASAITVEVTATNDLGSTMAESAGVTIAAPLSLSGTPAAATVGSAYSFTPTTAGGHGPYSYALTGTLPSGLSFNTATGAITGTPTTSGTASGLDITVTDADGLTASLGAFSITASAAGPVAGDLLLAEVLSSSAITTDPTNTINPNGRVIAMTFKGMGAGEARDHTKASFTVSYPGFDATGAATTVTETVGLNGWLRMPFPKAWASGESAADISVGERRSNRVSSKGNIYELVTAGGGTTANAPTHSTSVGQEVTGADGYTWRYLGNPTDSTSATTAAPYQWMETISGSDIIVYGVPSKSIPDGATITACNVQAGCYGASNASNAGIVGFTHSQTLTAPQPYLVPLTVPRQLVTTSIRLETVVWSHSARSQRVAACHKFLIYNSAGVLVQTETLTSMTTSTIATGGEVVQVFGVTADISGLADGDYYLKEECYPWVGRAFKTADDGYGPAALSTTAGLTANVGKWIPFTKDAAGAITRYYAYVDGVGAGTPAVSTTAATARTTPYANIKAAATALNTANGSLNNCVIRVMDKGSAYTAMFEGNMQSGVTYGKIPLVIEIDPLATPGSVEFATAGATATANKQGPRRGVFRGLKITGTSAASAIDNVAATGVGDFAIEQRYESCTISGVSGSGQNPISRTGLMWFVNCTLNYTGGNFGSGSGRSALKLAAGCTFNGGSTATQIAAIAWVGCVSNANGGVSPIPAPLDARAWAEGAGGPNYVPNAFTLYMFNRWPSCVATAGPVAFNGTEGASEKSQLSRGGVFVMNLVEVADTNSNGAADAKGGQYSGDSNTSPLPELHFALNTIPGDGPNIGYNEAGVAWKYLYGFGNLLDDINHKGDYWDQTTASETKIGNIFVRYHQDFDRNFIPGRGGSFNRLPSPGNNAGDAWGPNEVKPTSATPLDCSFTLDRSFFAATKTGGGDYHPTAPNDAIGMMPAASLAFPVDLDGDAWAANGNDPVGALKAA